jgi:type IV fimbrial biogenesis protein FimT
MTLLHRHSGGFTIIELMVTIAIAAVLLGLAVPGFGTLMRNNRLATQTNTVVGALNYARSETLVRGMPISVCAASSAARDRCVTPAATSTSWTNGWIVFTDRSGTPGTIDTPNDEVLQTGPGPANGFTVTNTGTFVRFGVGATPSTQRTFRIAPTNMLACAGTGRREIAVSGTGRVNTTKFTTCT